MKIKYRDIKLAAVFYAAIPVVIFFLGWLNIVSALIFTAALAGGVYFFIKSNLNDDGKFTEIILSKKQLIGIAVISFIWCLMAGQGGFVHQSSDHVVRNAILRDLIALEWPVTYDGGTSMMSYYIAHWMVPAVFGKLMLLVTGSKFAAYLTGNIVLLLWSSIGIFIALTLVALITNTGSRKRIFIAIAMFIFFSGLDIVGVLMRKNVNSLNISMHIEWWSVKQQFSANMTCLYWVYNQVIVPWIIILCLMNERRLKNIVLMGMLAFPYGPFPFVGIVIFGALKVLGEFIRSAREKTLADFFRDLFSLQNILAAAAIAPVYLLYYTSNKMVSGTGGNTGFRVSDDLVKALHFEDIQFSKDYFYWFCVFIILEFGLYLALILKRVKPDLMLIGMSVSLLFIPLFKIGISSDFAMRASIPALVYICITFIQVIMKEMPDWGEYGTFNNCMRHKKFFAAAMIVFIIGSANSCLEIKREFLGTIVTPYSQIMDYFSSESLQSSGKDNFVAVSYKDSKFYKYFCRKID